MEKYTKTHSQGNHKKSFNHKKNTGQIHNF